MKRFLPVALALLLVGPLAAQEVSVRYRTADTVYLTAGEAAGLAVGDRLTIERDGAAVGEVEVLFLAAHSASCRVVSESVPIEAGDIVTGISLDPPAKPEAEESTPSAPLEPGSTAVAATAPREDAPTETRQYSHLRPRLSGSVTLGVDSFSSGGDGTDFTRTTGRFSLRGRDVGGRPHDVRIRLRARSLDRDGGGASSVSTEDRHRLYEASLAWRPLSGRWSVALGRLGASPFVGLGFLDGVQGEVAAGPNLHVGAFFGLRPEVTELGLDNSGSKAGAFVRLHSDRRGRERLPFEMLVAGVVEDGDLGVSREYVLVETHYSGDGAWSFYQRAEIDQNNDWRADLSDSSSQLSSASITATGRLSEKARLSLSYDRFERYRTEETRFVPEELFDDLLRQGFRASLTIGSGAGWRWTMTGATRSVDGDGDDTVSFVLGVHRPAAHGRKYSLGATAHTFTADQSEGAMLQLRAGRRLRDRHRIDLTLGGRSTTSTLQEVDHSLQWARLGGWFELPNRLYLRTEIEQRIGDHGDGTWISAGAGYRF